LATTLVVTLALALRIIFLLGVDVHTHIAGDINDYVSYAWNLANHGIYSSATPGTAAPTPDTFRPPGYPLAILSAMWLSGAGGSWLLWAYALQILLSTATVYLTILFARQWLPPGYALAAGTLLAVWPHHVVFASTLLSETLLGFLLMFGLYLAGKAEQRRSVRLMALGGTVLGYAALVNTLLVLFPAAMALTILLARQRRSRNHALAMMLGGALLPLGWATLAPETQPGAHTTTDRAMMNLVQGAWPQYHRAWRTRNQDPTSHAIMSAIAKDVHEATLSPVAGVAKLVRYVQSDPAYYASWYLWEKPQLLWSWDIQLGWGGIYFLPTATSPFESAPVLKQLTAGLKVLNPWLLPLAVAGFLLVAVHTVRRSHVPFGLAASAALFAYVTIFHLILQAEPRYSIPYRPAELVLVLTSASWTLRRAFPRATPLSALSLGTRKRVDRAIGRLHHTGFCHDR